MKRAPQAILIVSTVLGSWLGMQQVHELGHVAGAWATRGKVERVVLHPLTISRTDLAHNPEPLIVVWAGPLLGVLLPLAAWGAAAWLRRSWAFVLRFFAGFCLIANGLYIGVGSFDGIGDCGEMLRHGSKLWHLWLFGIVASPLGLLLWHGEGPHFGLGKARGRVNGSIALGSLCSCLALVLLGLVIGGKQ